MSYWWKSRNVDMIARLGIQVVDTHYILRQWHDILDALLGGTTHGSQNELLFKIWCYHSIPEPVYLQRIWEDHTLHLGIQGSVLGAIPRRQSTTKHLYWAWLWPKYNRSKTHWRFDQDVEAFVSHGEALRQGRQRSLYKAPKDTDYAAMPPLRAIATMQNELTFLRQEMEFLKKIIELENATRRKS